METLKNGSKGANVKKLQYNLFYYFHFLKSGIDGIFGRNTENAVKDFQSTYGLVADGIAGINTLNKLDELVKQLQLKVNVNTDGYYGKDTIEAVKNVQKLNGLVVDGITGKNTYSILFNNVATGIDWSKYPNFKESEFYCPCGKCNVNAVKMNEKTIATLQKIRNHFGKPVIINSGIRCVSHNAEVGGVANSQHLYGNAVDIKISGVNAKQILNYLNSLGNDKPVYMYAITENAVHFDYR